MPKYRSENVLIIGLVRSSSGRRESTTRSQACKALRSEGLEVISSTATRDDHDGPSGGPHRAPDRRGAHAIIAREAGCDSADRRRRLRSTRRRSAAAGVSKYGQADRHPLGHQAPKTAAKKDARRGSASTRHERRRNDHQARALVRDFASRGIKFPSSSGRRSRWWRRRWHRLQHRGFGDLVGVASSSPRCMRF